MKRLFLCGVHEEKYNKEIIKNSRVNVEFSANSFQLKMIQGFKQNGVPIEIISAPFLSSYPKEYKKIKFKKFSNPSSEGINYIPFNNIWGLRNISRKKNCYKSLNKFIKEDDSSKIIYVYSVHTPFLEAAVKAKKIDSRIKICLIVLDLPQYMNLSKRPNPLYVILKKFDSKRFYKLNKYVDSYMLLTQQMANPLEANNKPHLIVEGIYEEKNYNRKINKIPKQILYAGKLETEFGILNLINAFKLIDDPEAKLIICGSGEAKKNVEKAIINDNRITYKGQISPDEAKELMLVSNVLVNPRQNNSDFTKYSFPSKTIDYLSTGNAVVGYELDGIPKQYEDFMFYVPDDSVEALKNTILKAMYASEKECETRAKKAMNYFRDELLCSRIIKKLRDINGDNNE